MMVEKAPAVSEKQKMVLGFGMHGDETPVTKRFVEALQGMPGGRNIMLHEYSEPSRKSDREPEDLAKRKKCIDGLVEAGGGAVVFDVHCINPNFAKEMRIPVPKPFELETPWPGMLEKCNSIMADYLKPKWISEFAEWGVNYAKGLREYAEGKGIPPSVAHPDYKEICDSWMPGIKYRMHEIEGPESTLKKFEELGKKEFEEIAEGFARKNPDRFAQMVLGHPDAHSTRHPTNVSGEQGAVRTSTPENYVAVELYLPTEGPIDEAFVKEEAKALLYVYDRLAGRGQNAEKP